MHKFGGAWTELKLDVIEGYLDFYTAVLASKPTPQNPFKLWYIDAFAGSGSRTVEFAGERIFEAADAQEVTLDGSARRALQIARPFHKYVFIEGNASRFSELERLKEEFPARSIECMPGDSNDVLNKLFGGPPWAHQHGGRGSHRAVVFLDPYGMSVKWSTLELLARSGSVDVWYLFPVEGVNRQMSGDLTKVEDYKRYKLEEMFGSADWQEEMYDTVEQGGLFDGFLEQRPKRGSKAEIEQYALRRLGSLFNYVSQPIRLSGKRRGHIFSLICLSNNHSPAAAALIKKGVDWLHKNYAYAGASRQR